MASCFQMDNIAHDLTSTFNTEHGISLRICCDQSILWSNSILGNSIRKMKQSCTMSPNLSWKKMSTLYTSITKICLRPSWACKPQMRSWRERFPKRKRDKNEAGQRGVDHCNNCSFCPPWLHYGQRKGRGCAIVYINPGWGWGRSKEARGGGGLFSSSAQHKPVRKQADSFNNINERQTSGEQALRLWGPAGPTNREILPPPTIPPLPTLQNLDMCLLREEKGFGVFF